MMLFRPHILTLFAAVTLVPLSTQWVYAETAVGRWEFGTEEETPLRPHGGVHRDVPGPRPPVFPDFPVDNTAVNLDGNGARFVLDDPGDNSPFDFTNGDAITLEAWVNVRELKSGENTYIIGKGRTGQEGFAQDNQNWALRIRGINEEARVSFLFATSSKETGNRHWHRYTSDLGFRPRTGWHHVAVTYRFGKPTSVQTWIDGKKVPGRWDMAGPTKNAPVVDNDQIWIGSSMGGAAGGSFRGGLDSVAIYRTVLDDETLQARFRRVGEAPQIGLAPETMPELGELVSDQVTISFHEGFPAHERWLYFDETFPPAAVTLGGEAFLLDRLPLKYDEWGIRTAWQAPVVVRMAGDVALPEGKHTLLLRARGLARVWVDGKLVTRTKPLTSSPNGEEPITPLSEPPAPGHRPTWHRCQEAFGEVVISNAGPVRVVVEAMAGGKRFRADPGELTVAVCLEGAEAYQVLRPVGLAHEPLPLTDEAVEAELAKIEFAINQWNDQTRRTAAASQDSYWTGRHAAARAWVAKNPHPPIPQTGGKNPIDAFISARLKDVEAETDNPSKVNQSYFHANILPILKSECFRCHDEKEQGGLTLSTREFAMMGGFSGEPAITPGDPHASAMIARLRSKDAETRMPPTGKPLPEEKIQLLEKWISDGAKWPEKQVSSTQTTPAPIIGDADFIRRVYLDTVGVVPTAEAVREFLADNSPGKREHLVERLLADERWADHWVSYWQDLLAENPTMINATLNSTGPFRWFLYDALRDNKPIDRMVTELILLRGTAAEGGSAGFGLAAQNDSPFAAKGHVVGSAFLGLEMQCARCHDSPYHSTTQRDLYSLAAMFSRGNVSVPKSSTVPAGFFEEMERSSLIKVTLKPGEPVTPTWPFAEVTGAADDEALRALMRNPKDTREKLATLVTVPQNTRFAQVIANRVWRRYIGAGIVEPPHDWEGNAPSHPELLDWLAKELVAHNYNLKHVAKVIMTSDLYQRAAVASNRDAAPEQRLFHAPDRRRMTAEQIVDSLYVATGCEMDVEELTLDPDGRRTASSRNTFGKPRRSWMLVSLSNERDRPSLTLPRAAMVVDVLTAFGWSADRQAPRTDRETDPNVLQPAVIANSNLTIALTRAAHQSVLADLAVEAKSPEALLDSIFLRFVSRHPTDEEKEILLPQLRKGFDQRLVPADQVVTPLPPERLPQVTWSNHLRNEADTIQKEHARRVQEGPPADPRLQSEWRTQYEDVVWSIANLREFVWMP